MSNQVPLLAAETSAFPAASRAVKTRVDELLNWYDRNSIQICKVTVECRPGTLRKFCKKQRGGPFMYRGKEIVPVRPAKLKQDQLVIA